MPLSSSTERARQPASPPKGFGRRPVGFVLPTNDAHCAELLRWLPSEAEQWGYDSLWITDHVVGVRAMAGVYSSYWLEALTALTWTAALTSKVRIGTGILVLPHRNPVLTAKMVATLDVLSGGRVDLGIGTGWSRVEFRSLGVEAHYTPRGQVTDESLEVICRCWDGGQIDHEGEFFSFRHVDFEPAPLQQPRVPIWVGGSSNPALRRAARFADVWHPNDLTVDQIVERGDLLDELAGRSVARSVRLAVTADDLPGLSDRIDAYLTVGCAPVVIEFRSLPSGDAVHLAESAASLLF